MRSPASLVLSAPSSAAGSPAQPLLDEFQGAGPESTSLGGPPAGDLEAPRVTGAAQGRESGDEPRRRRSDRREARRRRPRAATGGERGRLRDDDQGGEDAESGVEAEEDADGPRPSQQPAVEARSAQGSGPVDSTS